MTNQFKFSIPRTDEPNLTFTLGLGDVLYMLGANGTGKSSLISRLFSGHQATAKRISAHRQTWFRSNTLDMTPLSRESLEQNIRAHDAQEHARYRLDFPNERAGVAIYDLIDSDTMLARKIADLVRAGDTPGAEKEAKAPAPIQVINELMRLSNIPIEISLEERQKIIAKKNGGSGYMYEALGQALSESPTFSNNWGPTTFASDSAFVNQAYQEIFGFLPGAQQVQHFLSQVNYFESLYIASGAFGSDTNRIEVLVRGAVYGQMLGIEAEI